MHKRTKVSYAQTQLPFAGTTRVLATPFARERKVVLVLGSLLVVLSIVYALCIGFSVAHVASREDALRASRTLSAEIASIESNYFAEARGITEEYAHQSGFVASQARTFIPRLSAVSYASNAR